MLSDGAFRCAECSQVYPVLGGMPCLTPDPVLFLRGVQTELEDYQSSTDRRLAQVERESRELRVSPLTRQRLERIVTALAAERERVRALMQPLLPSGAAAPASAIPARPVPSADLAILKCYEHLFRDWCWGDVESEASRRLVERVLPGPLGRLAVFGAGAARLAADVHQTLGPTETLAIDLNPLPLIVAHELLQGRSLSLFEFPIGPEREEHVAIEQRLSCPYAPREGLFCILADALRPPIAPRALDSVLTPWFIDAAGVDLRVTAAAIGRALKVGGTWIQLGPLRFDGSVARQYVIEEVLEIVRASGFEVLTELRERVPYFDSPFSGSRRVETVLCFAARKVREPEPLAIPSNEARWLADAALPVPVTPELASLRRTAVFTSALLGMIDGKRSIAEIAQQLAGAWRTDPREVEERLRIFLSRLPRSDAG